MSSDNLFSGICNTPFWDDNVTWNTTSPAFTPCFTETVLRWLPAGFLWLLFPYTIWDYMTAKRTLIPWNWFNIMKLLASTCLFLTGFGHVIYEFILWNNEEDVLSQLVTKSELIGTVVSCVTYLLLVIYVHTQRVSGFINGGVVWFYLVLQCICSGLSIPTYIQFEDHQSKPELVFIYAEFGLQIILFFICSFSDKVPNLEQIVYTDSTTVKVGAQKATKLKICPKETASFPSKLTFWWFDSMVLAGFRRPLTLEDLWQIRVTDRACKMFENFNHFWKHKPFSESNFQEKIDSVKLVFAKVYETASTSPQINSFWIIVHQFWPYFFYPSFAKLVSDILSLASPTITKLMIAFTTDVTAHFWQGVFYSSLYVILSIFTSVIGSFHKYRMSVLGMRIRACLTGAVYRKSLVLANHTKQEFSSGEIVNLMSVDSQRFVDLLPWLSIILAAPFQIGISLWLLWNELGIAVLGGVVIMVILGPINGYVSSFVKRVQHRQMVLKDSRLKAINEMLSGMKVLKLYAWEQAFIDNIQAIRLQELNNIRRIGYIQTIFNLLASCTPFMVSCLTFAIFILIDSENVLTAEKAFVSIGYFNILQMPLTMLPSLMNSLITTIVSVKRLNKFLNSDETIPYIERKSDPVNAISVSDASFSWEQNPQNQTETKESQITLSKLNLKIPKNSLVAIVGNVGSGKSSFLSALLGEMRKVSGQVNIAQDLSLAYVPQQAWIQNVTVRDNIVFGNGENEKRYQKVISACALKPDLAMLPAGDQTEIGEKGINLSGGQKQRVSIARACYSDADLYLFDDPLSAVDSHVGKHIFDQVLSSQSGILKDKTRVLVTNALYMLPNVDQIVLVKKGTIEAIGSYDQLLKSSTTFHELITNYSKTSDEAEKDETHQEIFKLEEEEEEPEVDLLDDLLEGASPVGSLRQRKPSRVFKKRNHSVLSVNSSKLSSIHTAKAEDSKAKSNLIQVEMLQTGTINLKVFIKFLRSISLKWTGVIVLLYLLKTIASTGASFWLNAWTADTETSASYYLAIYFVIGMIQAGLVATGWIALVLGTLRASRTLHVNLLSSIVHAPMHFFDTTPLGRIVNRFSKDFDVLDTFIQFVISILLGTIFGVIASFFTISFQTPLFMIVVVPFLVIYFLIQRFYVRTSRQLKRIESITRSPIFTHFSETINGVSTIRAYGAAERFIEEFDRRVDTNQRAFFPSAMASAWIQVRLEFMANILIFFASFFVALSKDSENNLTGGDAGLSLTYAASITSSLNMAVRFFTDLENQVVCVERISEYSELEPEAAWNNEEEDSRLPPNWPHKGEIEFEGYGTRYRPGLDLVLRKIDITTRKGEKVGIVGRTGAGKSSLTLALFRIVEAANGRISMDGVDISKLGLQTLRSRITIIPQDPVLFCGTIRQNLDPFDKYTDEQLWHVLELSHLKSFVSGLELGLQHLIAEGGENLSVGQRQLICLGRALLRRTNVLVLDEATAAVDLETDSLIQSTIREQFAHCTVLTIAHRLNTILDSDRVMVLDSGNVAEFDSPKSLLANNKSIFYSLAKDAGIV